MADKVFFVKSEDGDITAVFPDLKDGAFMTCYAHVGQHSSCCQRWVETQQPALPEEYEPLKKELISIGYELKIIDLIQQD